MRVFASCLTIVLLAAASVAQAQDMEITEPPAAGQLFVDGGYGGYRGGYHASTLQEGFARGAADVVRSRGEFNRATSEAAVNLAEARGYEIDNLENWVDAFYNLRRKARDYRAAERRPNGVDGCSRKICWTRTPVEGIVAKGLMDWLMLATATAWKIQAIDPDHAVIVEPAPREAWGRSTGCSLSTCPVSSTATGGFRAADAVSPLDRTTTRYRHLP